MRISYQTQIEKRITRFRWKVLLEDILEKPHGKTILIPVYEEEISKNVMLNRVDQLTHQRLSQKLKQVGFIGKESQLYSFSLFVQEVDRPSGNDFSYEEIIVFGLGKRNIFQMVVFQRSFANVIRYMKSAFLSSASLSVDFDDIQIEDNEMNGYEMVGRILIEAFYLSQYSFTLYKSAEERKKIKEVREMHFYLHCGSKEDNKKQKEREFKRGLSFGTAVSSGVYLTRDLVNEPASHVYPKTLADIARSIALESAGEITCEVLDRNQCTKLGMGAFLGVAKGSDHEPQFIIIKSLKSKVQSQKLKTQNQNTKEKRQQEKTKKICLIGKSITFDSGGLSLKPADSMETMKIDMAGGATVLGFFHTLSLLKKEQLFFSPDEIYGILPACENMPSGKALRPGDIVTALNGKTIEVANTDAEGRLILADALSYAEKYIQPEYIVDLATLTGAIMVALGDEITGLFGNDADFTERVLQSAQYEGEEIWKMPLHAGYLSLMKSMCADIKNVSKGRYGGAITAALFLQEFVSSHTKWAHLDIAGASYNEGEAQGMREKGATGWGVKTLTRLIYDYTKGL